VTLLKITIPAVLLSAALAFAAPAWAQTSEDVRYAETNRPTVTPAAPAAPTPTVLYGRQPTTSSGQSERILNIDCNDPYYTQYCEPYYSQWAQKYYEPYYPSYGDYVGLGPGFFHHFDRDRFAHHAFFRGGGGFHRGGFRGAGALRGGSHGGGGYR
jgi:hypothetical protein